MKTWKMVAAVAGMLGAMVVLLFGGPSFTQTQYGTVTVPLAESVTFEWTNGTERVGLGSVMVKADAASNTWTILLVSNSSAYTNVLQIGSLNSVTNTMLYDGAESLAAAVAAFVAASPSRQSELRRLARSGVEHCFSMPRMAQDTAEALQAIVARNTRPLEPWPARQETVPQARST